jgi:hypothetical protein
MIKNNMPEYKEINGWILLWREEDGRLDLQAIFLTFSRTEL